MLNNALGLKTNFWPWSGMSGLALCDVDLLTSQVSDGTLQTFGCDGLTLDILPLTLILTVVRLLTCR